MHHPKTRVREKLQKRRIHRQNIAVYVQERPISSQKSPTNAPTPSFTESTNSPPTDSGACKFTKEPYLSANEPCKRTNACICSISQYITHRLKCMQIRKRVPRMRQTVLFICKRALFVRKRALQTHQHLHLQHQPVHHPEIRVREISQKNPTCAQNSHDYPQKSPICPQKSPTNAPTPSSAASASTSSRDWKFAKEPYVSAKEP